MQYVGIILHHSACPSINGKGYDFFVGKNGQIVTAHEKTEPSYIHVCVEGDYGLPLETQNNQAKEQFFVLSKLLVRLCSEYGMTEDYIFFHAFDCPGSYFPWDELVISISDGYH